MHTFELTRGARPLLVSMPHVGLALPPELAGQLTPEARLLPDTDWHLDRLYQFAADLGVSVIIPRFSRYVIDLNRPADDAPLYPGANGTGLIPTSTFAGHPLYRPGYAPDDGSQRLQQYWHPYHDAVREELERLVACAGAAVLFEAHSICSTVPRLFDGRLPDLNLGTASGQSCAPELRNRASAALRAQEHYSVVVDGRFKGGYLTREYGRPDRHIHALQLELSQATYMQEQAPFTYLPELAAQVQPVLRHLLETLLAWVEKR